MYRAVVQSENEGGGGEKNREPIISNLKNNSTVTSWRGKRIANDIIHLSEFYTERLNKDKQQLLEIIAISAPSDSAKMRDFEASISKNKGIETEIKASIESKLK